MLIDAADLFAESRAGRRLVLLDVRWTLNEPKGYQNYCDGHIPGALFVDLPSELSSGTSGRRGRNPLPTPTRFEETVRGWGIDNTDRVVVYDDAGNTSAARAWWLLRWAGLDDVWLLDGGLAAWLDAGGELAVGPGHPHRLGRFSYRGVGTAPAKESGVSDSEPEEPTGQGVVTMEEVAAAGEDTVLLDVRQHTRFTGQDEPVDPRAGHIPAARNIPTTDFLDDRGRFLPPAEIREKFADRGVTTGDNVVVYCGSGVHACHALAAMEIAGISGAKLYPGSWSQWSRDRTKPIEKGPESARVSG